MRNALCGWIIAGWLAAGCQNVAEQEPLAEHRALPPTDHGLMLTASPLRTIVRTDGPLEVVIAVHNLADTVVQFRPIFGFGGWLDADVLDSVGVPIPKTASIDPPNAWAISLGTGESVTDTVDLRCSLEVPAGIPCTAPYDFSHPGQYEVKMHFTLPCDIEGCDDFVKVEAESFTVRVVSEGV